MFVLTAEKKYYDCMHRGNILLQNYFHTSLCSIVESSLYLLEVDAPLYCIVCFDLERLQETAKWWLKQIIFIEALWTRNKCNINWFIWNNPHVLFLLYAKYSAKLDSLIKLICYSYIFSLGKAFSLEMPNQGKLCFCWEKPKNHLHDEIICSASICALLMLPSFWLIDWLIGYMSSLSTFSNYINFVHDDLCPTWSFQWYTHCHYNLSTQFLDWPIYLIYHPKSIEMAFQWPILYFILKYDRDVTSLINFCLWYKVKYRKLQWNVFIWIAILKHCIIEY